MNILDWIVSNWKSVTDVIAYIIAAASIIVKLTPSIKDNVILDKIRSFLGVIALNPTNDETGTNTR